jgi:hypothetical protein
MIICQPSLQDLSVLQAVTLGKMKYFRTSCISPFCQNVLNKIDWHACSFDLLLIQAMDMSDYVGLETLHFSALPVFKAHS